MEDSARINIGRFDSPGVARGGPMRCDLHPRWNRSGDKVSLDSTHEGGRRQIYVVDVSPVTDGPSGDAA
jgi:hypothetical protein